MGLALFAIGVDKMRDDVHFGFGRDTACGILYLAIGYRRFETFDGQPIRITGIVKDATCKGCREVFYGRIGAER